jgi:cbb3-type cytochrome oxidase subunit 3
MKGRTPVRIRIGALAVAAVSATIWIISLPNQTECRASGRMVDPTERHCTSATGYQQLQEHATFHAIQVVLVSLFILAVAYIIYRIIRRRSRQVASTA